MYSGSRSPRMLSLTIWYSTRHYIFMKRISSLALIIVAFAFPMTSAQAATCPDPVVSTGKITLTTTPDSSCYATGSGGVNLSPLVLLDKTPNDTSGLFNGALIMTQTSQGIGTFSVGPTGNYNNLVLVIKSGNLNGLQWGAFSLAALSGSWTIQDATRDFKDLSGGELWGSVSAVPVPAAVWLFGTALIGFIGLSRRTKV